MSQVPQLRYDSIIFSPAGGVRIELKQWLQDLCHFDSRDNIADYINEIDKIQLSVFLKRKKVKAPCLILNSDSQLQDTCCSGLSIIGYSPETFNFCDMHVTATSFVNS